jgi:hypothetical protein
MGMAPVCGAQLSTIQLYVNSPQAIEGLAGALLQVASLVLFGYAEVAVHSCKCESWHLAARGQGRAASSELQRHCCGKI